MGPARTGPRVGDTARHAVLLAQAGLDHGAARATAAPPLDRVGRCGRAGALAPPAPALAEPGRPPALVRATAARSAAPGGRSRALIVYDTKPEVPMPPSLHGGRRAGAGRPPAYREPLVRATVTLPVSYVEQLRSFGAGN